MAVYLEVQKPITGSGLIACAFLIHLFQMVDFLVTTHITIDQSTKTKNMTIHYGVLSDS